MRHIAVESVHVNKRLEVLRIYKLLVRYGIEVASICPQPDEVEPFVRSLKAVPKSGQHNPLKNPERCATEPCCELSCHAVAVTSRHNCNSSQTAHKLLHGLLRPPLAVKASDGLEKRTVIHLTAD